MSFLIKSGIFEKFAIFLKNGEWTKRNHNHKGKLEKSLCGDAKKSDM